MHLHLLTAAVLVDILGVTLETEKDIACPADFHKFHFTL